jgi:hypothetical protein
MFAKTAVRRDGSVRRCTPEMGWAIAVTLLPFLAALHLIFHVFSAAPIYPYSGLGQNIGHLFPPYPTIDFNVGVLSEAQGRRAVLDIFSGIIPWWNFDEGVGVPLAGNMQSAALFPLTLLIALPDGLLYLHLLLQAVAGLFTYLLMRRLGVSPFAAFTAGVLFEFNGTFAWLPTEPIAFLPMLLYGVELEMAQACGAWRWIAAALALSLYAGFPEMAYIDGLLAGVWTLARLAAAPAAQRMRQMRRILLGLACGLALSAPILIAFADYLAVAFYSLHANGFFSHQHLDQRFGISLTLPYLFGPILNGMTAVPSIFANWCAVGGYIGIGLPALGLLGMTGRTERKLRLSLVLWLAICVAIAYGLPGGRLLIHALLLSNAAFFRYFYPSFAMALAVLAGLALDDLARGMTKRRYNLTLIVAALLLVPGLLAVRHPIAALHQPVWVAVSLAMVVLVLGGMGLAGRFAPGRWRQILGALVIAEALFNFLLPSFDNPKHPRLELGGVHYLQAHLGFQRVFAMGPLEPNYGSYFNIAEIDDCDFPIPANWFAFRQAHLDPYAGPLIFDGHARLTLSPGTPTPQTVLAQNVAAYEATGVRYVVTKPDAVLAPALKLPKVYSDSVMNIYELPNPTPYFDAPGCMISPRSRNELVTDCTAASALTRLELFMPGWRAEVNGHHVAVALTGEIFQQIALPAGQAEVRFSFLPPHMHLGYGLFLAGLLLFFLPLGLFRRNQ